MRGLRVSRPVARRFRICATANRFALLTAFAALLPSLVPAAYAQAQCHGDACANGPSAEWSAIEKRLQDIRTSSTQGQGSSPASAASGGGTAGASQAWLAIERQLSGGKAGQTAAAFAGGGKAPIDMASGLAAFSQAMRKIGSTPQAPSAAASFGLMDLRQETVLLEGGVPMMFDRFGGRGASSPAIRVLRGMPLTVHFDHATRDAVELTASIRELNASTDRRTATQARLELKPTALSSLSLFLGHMSIERRGLNAQTEDIFSTYMGLSSYGSEFRYGRTDVQGAGLDLRLNNDRWRLRGSMAQSSFRPWRPDLQWTGAPDPAALEEDNVTRGLARALDFHGLIWKGEAGKFEIFGNWRATDTNFHGGGYEYMPGSTEWKYGFRANWAGMGLDYSEQGRNDETFGSNTFNRSLGLTFRRDWVNASVRQQWIRSTSSYSYLSYSYDPNAAGAPTDIYDPNFGLVPVLTKIENQNFIDSTSVNLRFGQDEWRASLSWRRSDAEYIYDTSAPSGRKTNTLLLAGEYSFGDFGVQLNGTFSDDVSTRGDTRSQKVKYEAGVLLSYSFEDASHYYGSGARGPRMPYGQTPYIPGITNAVPGTVPGANPLLQAKGSPENNAEQNQTHPPSARKVPEPATDWLGGLLPSSVRFGLVFGHMTQTGTDLQSGYYGLYGFNLKSPVGPYRGIDAGITWQGLAGTTDLSLRVTAADGDKDLPGATGGYSYEVALTQSLHTGPLSFSASLNGSLSLFNPGGSVERELYGFASVTAGYRLPWLTLDARLYGVYQQTSYTDGQPIYASQYMTAELAAELNLDQFLVAKADERRLPPYFRARGFIARQFPVYQYSAYSGNGWGVLLLSGTRF